MIPQKQIAELAGVSRGTVDRVLNRRGEVSEDTKNKVLTIVKALNYKPNRAGKSLVISQKNIKIGCIMIQADNPFYTELNQGIQKKAAEYAEYGIQILMRFSVFEASAQIALIDELMEQGINALVIQPANNSSLCNKINEISASGIPVVTTNTDLPNSDTFCYIGNDFYLCGKTAANLLSLFMHGRSRIGIVTGFFNAKSHSDRIDGFKEFLATEKDMKIIDIVENHDDEVESYCQVREMLQRHPEMDSLFIVAGGVYGAGRAIHEFQQTRPLCAISFDDVPTTREWIRQNVIQATICQQPFRQGELSLEVLFNYFIDGEIPKNKRVFTDLQIKLKANIDSN